MSKDVTGFDAWSNSHHPTIDTLTAHRYVLLGVHDIDSEHSV